MRVRVVGIALRHGGKRFEIGEVIDLADHPELTKTVEARLRAHSAEPVHGDGEMPDDLGRAIAAIRAALQGLTEAAGAALDVAEAGPAGYPQLLIDALEDATVYAAPPSLVARLDALSERARLERQQAIEQVAPAIEATSGAAVVDGPAAASTQNSEAPEAEATGSDTAVVAQPGATEAGDTVSADGAGSTPASDDAPQPNGGVEDDAGAAAAAPAEPAAQPIEAPPPAASTKAKRKPAPKGGQKGA